ncbi:MAG: hypothetical protein IPP71_07380 [Bacteroidetes bacterium]|nr:hypothetical protein [Bacteroidota bacterium]
MKYFLSVIFLGLLFLNDSEAQKLNEYTAANKITYMIGDTLTLGVGSSCDGFFTSINSSIGTTLLMNIAVEQDYDPRLPSGFEGSMVQILKIRKQDNKILFTFSTEDLGNFVVDIEAAIKTCEVAYCQTEGFLTQQQFEKLVLLYHACSSGTITSNKFDELRFEMINGVP